MNAQRLITRAARTPALRQQATRRFASSGPAPAGENAFMRDRRLVQEHAAKSTALWKKISIFAVAPAILLAAVNAYYQYLDHVEHQSHMPPLEERTQYAYQNLRTKNYPWGDGDKTLFWNPKYNYNKKD